MWLDLALAWAYRLDSLWGGWAHLTCARRTRLTGVSRSWSAYAHLQAVMSGDETTAVGL